MTSHHPKQLESSLPSNMPTIHKNRLPLTQETEGEETAMHLICGTRLFWRY
jgi:hypothetical protein